MLWIKYLLISSQRKFQLHYASFCPYMEKIDDNINNNIIFQTVLKSSKIPIINNDNKIKINMNRDNQVFQTAIVQSPLIGNFGIECRNCHTKPTKNIRYYKMYKKANDSKMVNALNV